MAELPVLGADRVGAAPRRQLGTRRYGARAADIDLQFIELAASPWLPTALNADAKT